MYTLIPYTNRATDMWPFLIQKFDRGFLGVSLMLAFDRSLNYALKTVSWSTYGFF